MSKRSSVVTCICLLLILLSLAQVEAQEYTVTDLGAVSAAYSDSYAYGISPDGQYVTGKANTDAQTSIEHIYRWTPSGGMSVISPTVESTGYGANDSGRLAGQLTNSYGVFCAYYDGSSLKTLGTGSMYNSPVGCAYGINSQNTITGQGIWGWNYGNTQMQGLVYNPSYGAYGIGLLPSANNQGSSAGYAVNEYGKIAGASAYEPDGSSQHAILWTPATPNGNSGTMVDLHTLADYTQSCAKAINDYDDVVGYCASYYGESYKRPFYKPASDSMQLLPTLDGPYPAGEANGINDSGVIIGCAGYLNELVSDSQYAVRWVNGNLERLDECIDLRSPWHLGGAYAINDRGQIVGRGKINGDWHAFLLTPIEDPTVSPVPHIDSVDPTTIPIKDFPAVLHVYGSEFTPASVVFSMQSSGVYPQRLATTFISETELAVDLEATGVNSIWVANPRPGGGESNRIDIAIVPNHSPNLGDDSASTLYEETIDIDVLTNDTDPDGDALELASAGWNYSYPYGSDGVSQNGGGVSIVDVGGKKMVRYTPPANFSGTDQFLYRVCDAINYYATATVTVTVVDTDQPPVAVEDSAFCLANQPVTVDVMANDSDPDLGDTISISSENCETAQGGMAYLQTESRSGRQIMLYNPPADFVGTDTFTYTIADSHRKTSTATVSVEVAEHLPPVAVDDSISIDAGVVAYVCVIDNDYDPNTDPYSSISVSDVSAPSHGSASSVLDDGKWQVYYQPEQGFTGVDTFAYTITNDWGLSATAKITVYVGLGLKISECSADPGQVASGDQVWISAKVTDALAQITSVKAAGVHLTLQGDDHWGGSISAASSIGLHYVPIEASNDNGKTVSDGANYQTCRVVATNTRALADPIMSQASGNFLFAVAGRVTTIPGDDQNFWLDDGGDPFKISCLTDPHGLSDGDIVRARGIYKYAASGSCLLVQRSSHITKP